MMREKKRAWKELSKQVKAKSDENKDLDRKLRELQVSVAERAQIEKLAGQRVQLDPKAEAMSAVSV